MFFLCHFFLKHFYLPPPFLNFIHVFCLFVFYFFLSLGLSLFDYFCCCCCFCLCYFFSVVFLFYAFLFPPWSTSVSHFIWGRARPGQTSETSCCRSFSNHTFHFAPKTPSLSTASQTFKVFQVFPSKSNFTTIPSLPISASVAKLCKHTT